MGSDKPRAVLIGALRLQQGLAAASVASLFSGERFAPEPLSDDERARLDAATLQDAPPEVAGAVAGLGRQRQGLAPASGTEVDDGLARPGRRQERGELGALILDFVPALKELTLDVQSRAAPVRPDRDAQAVGGVGRRGRREGGQSRCDRVAVAAQGVDPDVEGRAPGQGLQLRDEIVAEGR